MTQEETIINLEKLIALFHTASEQSKMVDYSKIIETLEFAATALRPIRREQVEKVWRGEWTGNFNAHCSRCDTFSTMAYIGQGGNFCPHCGAPMTDEAVQMVMKRLEEMYK